MNRRVVITGTSSVSPFGIGLDTSWSKLIAGESCISEVESVDLSDCRSKIGGEIKWSNFPNGGWFDPSVYLSPKSISRAGKFITYGVIASRLAMQDAGLDRFSDEIALKCGVIVGTGAGGMDAIEDGVNLIAKKGISRLNPFFVPSLLCNLVNGQISIEHNAQGPSFSLVSACASSNNAIGEAYRQIKSGYCDIVIAGGSESAYSQCGFGGFAALRALSMRNNEPKKASRPYDRDRDGFVMSEGSAILILEDYDRARKRGAKIYGEIKGYGVSSDANHITSPHAEGRGAIQSMNMALEDANFSISDIDYINAHGTSTPLGDELEINAIRKVFKDEVGSIPISSTKSSTGHMLGATAALEAMFCIKALEEGVVPATINLDNKQDIFSDLNLVPNIPQEKKMKNIMSNAFGFGGCNATIVIGSI